MARGVVRSELEALVATNALAAWKSVGIALEKKWTPKQTETWQTIIKAFAPHAAKLPAYRRALAGLVGNRELRLDAIFAMKRAPHADYIPALVADHEASLQRTRDVYAEFGENFGHAWDDSDVLEILSKVCDARAVPVLDALLVQATKVAYWNLLLDACVASRSPTLIPGLRVWLAKAGNSKWEGIAAGKRAIAALEAIAKAERIGIPLVPTVPPFDPTPKPPKPKSRTRKSKAKRKRPPTKNKR